LPTQSCITEDQKYQGALYKNKKAKNHHNANNANEIPIAAPIPRAMPQKAYVEDVAEATFADYEYDDGSDNGKSPADLPEAPTPPPAHEAALNVFDFLDNSATPNASVLQLGRHTNMETQMVRYEAESPGFIDAAGDMVDEDPDALVQYGIGPIPGAFETPAPGRERRRKEGSEQKKDKKRKRLHIDTDQVMDDAPPMLHTGLTGGINRMMRSHFPPSPDYSGGDAADPSPASPLKKKKHSKHSKSKKDSIGSNLMGLLGGSKSSKSKKIRKVSTSSKKSSSSSHRHRERDGEKPPALIEYRPGSSGEGGDADNQMVVFRPRGDLFLSYVNKGPDSERGYSVKKALRHFHRERTGSDDFQGKSVEEKELWRSLRMRKNERGEIVLFGL
jgi:cell growth-regulating nucleolar protein